MVNYSIPLISRPESSMKFIGNLLKKVLYLDLIFQSLVKLKKKRKKRLNPRNGLDHLVVIAYSHR